ncbi:hypothetical protein T10_541 [Trichinella papuae]|uniref:Uncharacterized protein n=1 Tax=Trichinella papuae TaxID=268474 RepID=A0A0V1M3N1_9BILA|nr:hypothetical protein T10_3562 [Trichinella papuae]KRZ66022.1 hypothetical protein T10_382 [Trichinella papuae]KRZ66048.1 hypothetical protein T10_8293 [Trichinella papuae]KRZ66202.1 hypothetical protein T10_541 [Trichinella papuae]
MQRYGELAYLISCYTRVSQPETENGMNYKTLALYWTFLSIEMENSTVKIIEKFVKIYSFPDQLVNSATDEISFEELRASRCLIQIFLDLRPGCVRSADPNESCESTITMHEYYVV